MAERTPFTPRLGEAYESRDSITGSRDKTADENKLAVIKAASSLTSGLSTLGTTPGTVFYATAQKYFVFVKAQGASYVTATV